MKKRLHILVFLAMNKQLLDDIWAAMDALQREYNYIQGGCPVHEKMEFDRNGRV